jgi:CubicO group peptidase (beta-lactamase class C family)
MHSTATGVPIPLDPYDAPEFLRQCVPGGGGRGPVRQLGRLYEALLHRGELDGRRVLLPQTVEALTARHRVGLYDETFHAQLDWGLGFSIDAFAMGRHASPRTFGHGGALSAIALADPEHRLVAVVQTNGMCGNDDHYLRLDAVTTALYEDLGLAAPGAPGRDKPFPSVELTVSSD